MLKNFLEMNVANRQKMTEKLNIWSKIWILAGRVPFSQKIIGIVVAPLLILGLTMAWWVSNELGGWLSYLLSEERVEQAMLVGMRGVFIITVFAAVAGLVIASFLIWVLTRPILHITRVARQVEKGDLSLRAPVWAKDEIGELGSTFNAMIESLARSRAELEASNEQLRRRNRELAALYELAQMASRYTRTEMIVEYGLENVLTISGAEAGMIALLDNSAELVVSAHRNMPPQLLDTGRAADPIAEFVAGVITSGEPVLLTSLEAAPAKLAQICREAGYASYLCLPIGTKSKVLGVLNILCSHLACLEAEQDTLLMTVCHQLGIAIENSRLWEELRHKEQVRAQLLNKVVAAQEEERRRISRELHDETGQSLTSLLLQLKVLERTDDIETTRQRVRELRDLTAQTLEEVRRLSLDLRPAALDDLGLVAALEWYVSEYSRKVGIKTDFQAEDLDGVRLPREAEATVYRVVQEALSNIARHSRATRVWVEIRREAELLRVSVRDNGQGFNLEETLQSTSRGLGLLGMQERMELIGGTLRLTSHPGEGTRVYAQVNVARERLTDGKN